MVPLTFADAIDAMTRMRKGEPYALSPEDAKRRLVAELAAVASELEARPLIIGGLAVNHHGYLRFTNDVDVLVARQDAAALLRRLRSTPGWRRSGEGFRNTYLDVGLDICVEGEPTAPRSAERFPDPGTLRTVAAEPLPVPSLADLIALKVMSARARDDADVVELLKRHFRRAGAVAATAARRLRTAEARDRLARLLERARDERARRR